jgi:hypothetical protein
VFDLSRTRSRVPHTRLAVVGFPAETNSSTAYCSKWLALLQTIPTEIETHLQINSEIVTRNANEYRFNQFPLFEIRNESTNSAETSKNGRPDRQLQMQKQKDKRSRFAALTARTNSLQTIRPLPRFHTSKRCAGHV